MPTFSETPDVLADILVVRRLVLEAEGVLEPVNQNVDTDLAVVLLAFTLVISTAPHFARRAPRRGSRGGFLRRVVDQNDQIS